MTSRWQVETTAQFDREFKKLDRAIQRRVIAYLDELEGLENPRQRGKALTAHHAGVWRYRVGDYRILAQIVDTSVTIVTLWVGHRSDVY